MNLKNCLKSGLPWGLLLYGEEDEAFLAASKDPTLSAIWEVGYLKGQCHKKTELSLHPYYSFYDPRNNFPPECAFGRFSCR